MKRIANSFRVAHRFSGGLIPFFLGAVGFPLLILAGFGLYFVFEQGHFLLLFTLLAVSAAIAVLPVLRSKRHNQQLVPGALGDSLVSASTDWSDFDQKIWEELNDHINLQLAEQPDWGDLKEHGLALISLTADRYSDGNSGKEWEFSAPELLKLTEEVSRRYRQILKTHVPLVEKIKLSTLKMLFDHKDKTQIVTVPWNAYRAYRLFSPLGAFAEARGQILGRVFDGANSNLQIKLKQALLQEVLSVAIDLYSGRFQVSDDELEACQAAFQDQTHMAKAPDPLRVCLLGQISAGKSSVVNGLTKNMMAEVSKLPSTNDIEVHQCELEGVDTLHLVDLPGLDAVAKREKMLLEQITNCDLVLWVLKANQPARSLDTDFKRKIDAYYEMLENRSRKRPAIIGVLNQVDRLKPVNEWDPPYDLSNPSSAKAKTIADAVVYNQGLMDLEYLVPLSISDDKASFNLAELESLIDRYYEKGLQAQLNRRRIESGNRLKLTDQAIRIYQTGKSLYKIMSPDKDTQRSAQGR